MPRRESTVAAAAVALASSVIVLGAVLALAGDPSIARAPSTLERYAAAATVPAAPMPHPLVIAHRGASAYRPEHTLAAYDLAISLGADYVEADLVPTRDGVLIARHENELSETTDVASHPEFASRRRTATIEGHRVTGWFSEDFTAAEIQTLRARERSPRRRPAAATYNDRYAIPTLQQIIDLVRTDEARYHRVIGLYLETKTPAYFTSLHLALEPRLAQVLHANHLDGPNAPVYLESFDAASLKLLHTLVRVPLIQLIGGASDKQTSPAALTTIAGYANGIGVDRARLAPLLFGGVPPVGPTMVGEAHDRGLVVHVYTFAEDTAPTPPNPAAVIPGDPPSLAASLAELRAYFAAGVDGVFTDNPEVAVQARTTVPQPRSRLAPRVTPSGSTPPAGASTAPMGLRSV